MHNIVSLVTGRGELEKYAPKFHGAMLSVGSRYGCAYIGGRKRKISLASFFAMLTKHLIYIIYFIQILGWKGFFEYIRNEFFTIRRRRSILGGHFSNRTPSFLLVPLRVFLGAYWVFEGIKKIGEGWLESPKLRSFSPLQRRSLTRPSPVPAPPPAPRLWPTPHLRHSGGGGSVAPV